MARHNVRFVSLPSHRKRGEGLSIAFAIIGRRARANMSRTPHPDPLPGGERESEIYSLLFVGGENWARVSTHCVGMTRQLRSWTGCSQLEGHWHLPTTVSHWLT